MPTYEPPTFRENLSVVYARVNQLSSSQTAWPLWLEPIDCPETIEGKGGNIALVWWGLRFSKTEWQMNWDSGVKRPGRGGNHSAQCRSNFACLNYIFIKQKLISYHLFPFRRLLLSFCSRRVSCHFVPMFICCISLTYTRWFKYDREKLWLVYTQTVPVIFEPPCMFHAPAATPHN